MIVSGIGLGNEQARHAWVTRQIRSLPPGARILDVGAGGSPYKPACNHLHYVAQDFAGYDGVGDATGLQNGTWTYDAVDIISDITSIPVPDASFDAALCTEVIEHVPNPVAALDEIARVLKPDAVLLLTAPFASLTHQAPHFYVSGFAESFYRHHLNRLEFMVEIERNGSYLDFLAQELRRLPSVSERYARAILGDDAQGAIGRVLGLLSQLRDRDTGSSELLCFGLHVKATRGQLISGDTSN